MSKAIAQDVRKMIAKLYAKGIKTDNICERVGLSSQTVRRIRREEEKPMSKPAVEGTQPPLDEKREVVTVQMPTGKWFLRDEYGNVWDGENWRGFGYAAEYISFLDAVKAARIARTK